MKKNLIFLVLVIGIIFPAIIFIYIKNDSLVFENEGNKDVLDANRKSYKSYRGSGNELNGINIFDLQKESKKPTYNSFDIRNIIKENNQVLSGADPDDTKIQSIENLGSLIRSGVSKSDANIIRSELERILLTNSKSKIGRAAFFTYTRSFNSKDSVLESKNILDLGLSLGVLNNSEFSGESVHMGMLFNNKDLIMSGLKTNEEYAKTVLYNYFGGSQNEINSSINIVDGELLEFVKDNAVKFSGSPFGFSMMEAVRYNEWLNSFANIKSSIYGVDAMDVKAEIFNKNDSDPREMIAAIIADKNDNKLVSKILSDDKYRPGIIKLNLYLRDYNDIQFINSISNEVDPRIKGILN